ncbi:hypothetical protein EDB83DRAFT_2521979 [Lactarius deliciosus]|nr:hypothetical protein EDB83DRAFT_2521979 [Lactarius deliciosus]
MDSRFLVVRSPPRSVFSAFFKKGQVLGMFRGRGIYQPAIDTAIEKLRGCIHLFAEEKPHRNGDPAFSHNRPHVDDLSLSLNAYTPRPRQQVHARRPPRAMEVPIQDEARRREDREVRIALTEVVQRAVEVLERQMSGTYSLAQGLGLQPSLPPPLQKST